MEEEDFNSSNDALADFRRENERLYHEYWSRWPRVADLGLQANDVEMLCHEQVYGGARAYYRVSKEQRRFPPPSCQLVQAGLDNVQAIQVCMKAERALRSILFAPFGLKDKMQTHNMFVDRYQFDPFSPWACVCENLDNVMEFMEDGRHHIFRRRSKTPVAIGVALWYFFLAVHYWIAQSIFDPVFQKRAGVGEYVRQRGDYFDSEFYTTQRMKRQNAMMEIMQMVEHCVVVLRNFSVESTMPFFIDGWSISSMTVGPNMLEDWELIKQRNLRAEDFLFDEYEF